MAKGEQPRIPQLQEKPQPQASAAVQAKFQQALAFHQRGQLDQAELFYHEILTHVPDHFDALHLLGIIEGQRGNAAAAVELLSQAITVNPNDASAHSNIGNALQDLKRPEEALASHDRALALKPDFAGALNGRGNALLDLKRPDEALASYDLAIKLQPDSAEALNNRGNVLISLKRPEEALASYDRALKLQPDYVDAINGRGNALRDLKRPEEALASYNHALRLQPNSVEALNNRGNALLELKRPQEALESYDRALAAKPDYAEALYNRGNALRKLRRQEDAVASYDRALAIKPDYADALNNRGHALLGLERHEDAAKSYARLLELAPDHDYALGYMLHSQLLCCDWTQYVQNAEKFVKSVNDGKRAGVPFSFLAASQSAADQLQCARIYAADEYPASPTPVWTGQRYSHDRIRVAYLSADFHDHAVPRLTAGLFEAHDKTRFEITAVSLGPDRNDEMRARLRAAFDRFIDVRDKSDREVALLLRELEIDIAVDLQGFTKGCRLAIFSHRAAPAQVNYLGYPGTMGVSYIDYIIADDFVIPEDKRAFYSEKVVYLPDSFQANDDRRKISEKIPARLEAGLPESGFVFCSFNNSYKINPAFFEVWTRLLKTVAGSVLWLVADNLSVQHNLRGEAAKRGIEPQRLIFTPRLQYADHLARFRLADLFLDSLPFNAGTTASDALWAGVPVLTCSGEAFASRMAGSLLNAIGLPELITHSLEEYEALALKLAMDSKLLADLRARLARNRTTHPLFDTDRFRRHIESAYITMWERFQRGEPPVSFAVQPIRQLTPK